MLNNFVGIKFWSFLPNAKGVLMKAKDWNIANLIKSKLNIDIFDVNIYEHNNIERSIEKELLLNRFQIML